MFNILFVDAWLVYRDEVTGETWEEARGSNCGCLGVASTLPGAVAIMDLEAPPDGTFSVITGPDHCRIGERAICGARAALAARRDQEEALARDTQPDYIASMSRN